MAFNINEFLSSMTRDGARPNLFEIVFAEGGKDFTVRAKATNFPESSIGVATANYFGRAAKFAGNRVFGDWTVSILVDEPDFDNGPRAALERWGNRLNSHIGNIRDAGSVSPASYMRDAQVIQYGKSGDKIATYHMRQCFPINVGPMPLDWGNNNVISEFAVTFAMQYWERDGITT